MIYFAHAGHQHLTQEAARTHNDQTTMVVLWAIVGAVLVAATIYALYVSRSDKKSDSKEDL